MNAETTLHRRLEMRGRRNFLRSLACGAALFTVPGAFAELIRTPRQEEGPFYPDKLPLDTDNDLIIVNNSLTPAIGEITYLSGRILDSRGDPIRNATVEIWEADHNGIYINTRDKRAERDKNFQGFGRFLTGSTGEYTFRTIKPTGYPGRAPHIHFAIKVPRQERFTTQCYVQGEPRNDHDFVLSRVTDSKARKSVIIPFKPLEGSRTGELSAAFDIVLGFTPEA
jgi:protocatechuate 3,4-dioxygenase beta subunit